MRQSHGLAEVFLRQARDPRTHPRFEAFLLDVRRVHTDPAPVETGNDERTLLAKASDGRIRYWKLKLAQNLRAQALIFNRIGKIAPEAADDPEREL
jgi:hypothetical protein